MTEAVVKVGEKGQVLIPKILRDQFGIFPGQDAFLQETKDGVLIKRLEKDPIKLFEETAKKVRLKRMSAKEIKALLDEQYRERFKRVGINV